MAVAGGSLACNAPRPTHFLYTVTSQTNVDDGVMVCFCERCKKTLTIKVHCPDNRCRPGIERMHHLVQLGEPEKSTIGSKYYPATSYSTFMCTAKQCNLTVTVEICEPRLTKENDAALIDREAVLARLTGLIESEPTRYSDLTSADRQARLLPASYLMLYLNDTIIASPERSESLQVSIRNKFFSACFSDKFEDLFDFLEFQKTSTDDDQYLKLPVLGDERPPSGVPTNYTSRRAWFEIVRIHLRFLLPVESLDSLKKPIDFGMQDSPREPLSQLLDAKYTKSVYKSLDEYNPDDFNILGVEKDMHESLLWYAGLCQKQANPTSRQITFEALSRVSKGRESTCTELREFLFEEGIDLATLASSKDAQPTNLSRAYQFFKLEETCPDAAVAAAFSDALSNSAAQTERKAARLNLSSIAKARGSNDLLQSACTFHSGEQAAEFLDANTNTDPEYLCSLVAAYEDEESFDGVLHVAALRTLAQIHDNSPILLSKASEIESKLQTGDGPAVGTTIADKKVVDFTLPVGLQNIRNTCYLNSILQYFNTVIPVRNLVLNWEDYKLEPTEENIRNRRLWNNYAVEKRQVFLASKFIEEMRGLFLQIDTSNVSSVRPEQRLAIAALNTSWQLVQGNPEPKTATVIGPQPDPNTNKDSSAPPTLPPRPDKPSTESQEPSTGPTVTVTPVGDNTDTGSNVSSVTLVDQKDGESDQTNVTTIPPAVPAKTRSPLDDDDQERGRSTTREQVQHVDTDTKMGGTDETSDGNVENSLTDEQRITKALDDTTVTGTSQQDIEEIMGNILEHFQAAIKSTGTDEGTGAQLDAITETFYWTYATYVRNVDMKSGKAINDYRISRIMTRWMTAFPAEEGKTDLYTGLDTFFDQQYPGDAGLEMFTSITKAPPILHIYIQRGQSQGRDASYQQSRNNNIVEIPEVLYLDRYMDGDSTSDIWKKRQQSWNLKRRLKALDGRSPPPEAPKDQTKKEAVNEAEYEVVDKDIDTHGDAFLTVDTTGEGENEEEYVSVLDAEQQSMLAEHGLLPGHSGGSEDVDMGDDSRESHLARLDPEASKRMHAKKEQEKSKALETLSTLFTDMHNVAYRLHAVICHGGNLGGGHYWVWIHDFVNNVWRKYNDEQVEVHQDHEKVMRTLNSDGQPYYLAYVRESEIDQLVAIPNRAQPSTLKGDGLAGNGEDDGTVNGDPSNSQVLLGSNGRGSSTIDPALLQHVGQGSVIEGVAVDTDMEDAEVMHVEDRND